MINAKHLLRYIIAPTLNYLEATTKLPLASESAKMLLLGTQAHESHGHYWLSQFPQGPARGGYQMEVATHDWLVNDYIATRHEIKDAISVMIPAGGAKAERMTYDLEYATAMARIFYWTKPDPLPDADDIEGLAAYWKQHWNTPSGKGSKKEFMENFRRFGIREL